MQAQNICSNEQKQVEDQDLLSTYRCRMELKLDDWLTIKTYVTEEY